MVTYVVTWTQMIDIACMFWKRTITQLQNRHHWLRRGSSVVPSLWENLRKPPALVFTNKNGCDDALKFPAS